MTDFIEQTGLINGQQGQGGLTCTTPVFADVDPATFNVTPATLARAITPKTVAVVPTHLWGLPCDMDGIVELARKHKLAVIEDCAHALGATYRERPVGTIGDASLFSFQTLKPLNTYGGGMAVTRDTALADRIAALVAAEPAPTVELVKKRLWHGRVQRISIRPRVFTWTLLYRPPRCSVPKASYVLGAQL